MRINFKVIIVVTVLIFFCMNNYVFGIRNYGEATYHVKDMDKKFEYSYTSEYEKYIGLYYVMEASAGTAPANMSLSPSDKEKLEDLRSMMSYQELNITEYELKFLVEKDNGTGSIIKAGYTMDELDKLCEQSDYYKLKTIEEFKSKVNGTLKSYVFLQKGIMNIRDNAGKVVAKIPHYIMCERNPYDVNDNTCDVVQYVGGTGELSQDINQIFETSYNFKNNLNPYEEDENGMINTDSDFWGDASSWFGAAQGSYKTPEEVDSIINIFTDMINVVGTTVIVIATIVLGIKYMLGTVESRVDAKEGLITLFIACIFFFGWTYISDLLYGGDEMNFIFTSSQDTNYKQMVGRLFSTFTYIAQFVAVGVIIYVGIKYIFAGASGRAELKTKSAYFIIGLILVFCTTNVLNFVSDIIRESLVK